MTMTILTAILATAVTAGTPLLFAALGEILTERAGILNLGVEGMMLVGAVSGFASAYYTGNPWLGVAVAMVAGGLMALIHAFLSVTMRANQVVSGLALTMFGTGLSSYLGKVWGVVGNPFPNHFRPVQVPGLAEIPLLGQVLFHQDVLVLASFVLAAGIWFLLYRTRTGMNLRAVGENPAAADSLGINVFALRYLFTIAGGMLAGWPAPFPRLCANLDGKHHCRARLDRRRAGHLRHVESRLCRDRRLQLRWHRRPRFPLASAGHCHPPTS